jgi:hypothetical protein
MEYLKVEWAYDINDEPSVLYSELDHNRNEWRKIEIYKNGSTGYTDGNAEYLGTRLSTGPLPTLQEIAADPEFLPRVISRTEFEQAWLEAASEN